MKCNSIRKEDYLVTVCVLCTLSLEVWLLLPNIIAVKSLMPIHTVAAHWVFIRTRIEVKLKERSFRKVYHSIFIIPLSLLIVNIWKMDIWLSMALFHYTSSTSRSFPSCLCVLQSFFSNSNFSCFSLSGGVSNIVQCSTLESACEYLINRSVF